MRENDACECATRERNARTGGGEKTNNNGRTRNIDPATFHDAAETINPTEIRRLARSLFVVLSPRRHVLIRLEMQTRAPNVKGWVDAR